MRDWQAEAYPPEVLDKEREIYKAQAAAQGKPAPVVAVRLQVGPVAKEVWAIGDRSWELTGATDPVPFAVMSRKRSTHPARTSPLPGK